jgi:UDP-N-acetylmuramoyl-tripeptide--D-alanyl-D-alanine ligase
MVDALLAMPAKGRHIVVAGEMLELGQEGEALHRACGRRMASRGVDIVIGVRGLAKAIVEGAHDGGVETVYVSTPEEAGAWLKANLRADDVVLLKASRGVRLERALAALTE